MAGYDLDSSSYGDWIDISARGRRIVAPISTEHYFSANGTSGSAAIAAGLASKIYSRKPDLTLDEMMALLYSTLVDLEPPGYDVHTGFGRVDTRRLNVALGTHYLDVPWLTVAGVVLAQSALESVDLETLSIVGR